MTCLVSTVVCARQLISRLISVVTSSAMLTVHVVQVNHSKAVWLVNKVNNKIKVWVCTQTKVDFPDSQC